MYKGVQIEKDPSINKLVGDVFSQMDKIANPVGQKVTRPTGFGALSVEDALKELLEIEKKIKTSNSPQP